MKFKLIVFILIMLLVIGCSRKHIGIIVGVKYDSMNQIPITTAVSANEIDKGSVKYFSSDNSLAKALNSGKTDLAILPVTPLYTHNYPNVKILNNFVRGGFGILGNAKTDSLSDLKGKTIGVLKKTMGEFLLQKLSDSLQIKIKLYSSLKLMELDFTYEKIGGMVLSIPDIVRKNSLKYKILFWFSDYFSYYTTGEIAVNKNSYMNHKNEIEDFISKLESVSNKLMNSPRLFFETNKEIFKTTLYKAKEISYRIRFIKSDFSENYNFERDYFNFMKEKGYSKIKTFKEILNR